MFVVLSSTSPSPAQEEDGYFVVRSAYAELLDGVYYLNAQVDYGLSKAAMEAINSGVTLTLELQIEVARARRFIWDKSVASLRQRYELKFHALSERYLVRNLNSGEQASHFTLASALESLGKVSALPIIDEALLDSDKRYEIGLRAVLDSGSIPGPLRLLAIWWDDWRLTSEWYTWPLYP